MVPACVKLTPVGLAAGDPGLVTRTDHYRLRSHVLHLWLYGQDQAVWIIQAIRPDGTDLHVVVPGTEPLRRAGRRAAIRSCSPNKTAPASDPNRQPDGSDVRDVATFPSTGEIEMYPVQQPMP